MRNFLFMAGEFAVTMPLVFSFDNWSHTMSKTKLIETNGKIHRSMIPAEELKGVIFFADQCDKELEISNLELLEKSGIECWPNPNLLSKLTDRHQVLAEAVRAGFVSHAVVQGTMNMRPRLPFPFVLKTGVEHRGEGKHLIIREEDFPEWEGIATAEPFFNGESIRILIIGEKSFGIKFTNEISWIKNSAGSDIEIWENPLPSLVAHAKAVAQHFQLEIVGVDYILTPTSFHFLEINQFPGVNSSDETAAAAMEFLKEKMEIIERNANLIQIDSDFDI